MAATTWRTAQTRGDEASEQPVVTLVKTRRRSLFEEAVLTLAVGGAALLAAVFMLQLWRLDLHVPMYTGADIRLNMGVIKNVVEGDWFYTTSHLGYPFGQQLYDYRSFSGDTFNLALVKILGLVSKDPAVISNLFIVISYPLVAMTAYLGSRLVGLRRVAAVIIAVVFAALPFHQSRNTLHLFYANYSSIPLAVAFALRQAGARPLVRRISGRRLYGFLHRDVMIAVAIIIVTATSGSYFGAFTCLFLLFSIVLALLRRRWQTAIVTAFAIVAIGGIMVAQTLPYTFYQRAHGENDITVRSVMEFDIYPLRPAQMLLPVNEHRIPFVQSWRDALPLVQPTEGSREPLGLFGASGFVLCGAIVVWQLTRLRKVRWSRRLAHAPLMMFGTVLISMFSGLNWLVGAFGFTQVRAWNRISVYVAFLCVAMTAVGLEHLLRHRRRLATFIVVPLIVVAAVLDQSTQADVPEYAERARQWRLEEDLVVGIERTLGDGAAVFELPIVDYPENPTVVNLPDYAQLYGYLHSTSLNWSYGGVKGRKANWLRNLNPLSAGFVDDLLIAGFTGVTVNLAGYDDRGAAVLASMRAAGILPTLQNDALGGLVFADLRPALAHLNRTTTAEQRAARLDQLFASV